MPTEEVENDPEVPRRLVRSMIVLWVLSAAASLLITGLLLVLVFLVIAATMRAGH
jgi:hypothetical protein